MHIVGPTVDTAAACEGILRTLPRWFGIEASLMSYVQDTARWPTFLIEQAGHPVAFLTVRRHFPGAWEINCIAVHAGHRGQGLGAALHRHVEQWLRGQEALLLQVKTLAAGHPSPEYAETRRFYTAMGYLEHEEFPALWGPGLPVLQLVKVLAGAAFAPSPAPASPRLVDHGRLA